MTGKVLNIFDYIQPDNLGCAIGNKWVEWNMLRQNWLSDCKEIRQYLFATDTTMTTNSKLPWKNKTTIPKLTQIRDNLNANYMAVEFPASKSRWLDWYADTEDSNQSQKRDAILAYMQWVVSQPQYKSE